MVLLVFTNVYIFVSQTPNGVYPISRIYIYIYSYLCSEIFMQLVKIDIIKTNYK